MSQINPQSIASPEQRQQLSETLQDSIKHLERWTQVMLKVIDKVDDVYRLQGTIYHTTSMHARTSPGIRPDVLRRLEAAFTDYNVWFQPWKQMQELLLKLLHECRSYSTVEALIEHQRTALELQEQIHQAYNGTDEVSGVRNITLELDTQTGELVVINRRLTDSGIVTRWYLYDAERDQERSYHLPGVVGPEWEAFRQWVYTLPETRKAMGANANPGALDRLASEMLYKNGETFWDGHWSGPEPNIFSPIFTVNDMQALGIPQGNVEDADVGNDGDEFEFEIDVLNPLTVDDIRQLFVEPPLAPVASHAVPGHEVVEDGFID